MHVEVSCQTLRPAVKTAASLVQKTERPILRNVLLEGTPDGLEVTASDMSVSLWLRVAAIVQDAGSVCVNAKDFQKLLESAQKQDLVLKAEARPPLPPKDLKIKAGKAKFQLLAEDPKDFPKVTRFSTHRPYVRMKAKTLADMVARTAFCAHTEVSHFLMHGLLVAVKDGEMRMAATNGQRLSVAYAQVVNYSSAEPFDATLVIPADQADMLKKIAADMDEVIDLQWMANSLNARGTLGEVTVRALSGTYPNYEMGIPKNSKKITFDRKTLIEILKQTNVFNSTADTFVHLKVDPDKMTFNTVVDGSGTSQVEHDHAWEHKPMKLILSPDFLLQSASVMLGDAITLEVEHEMAATLLRETRDDGFRSFCVYAVVRK